MYSTDRETCWKGSANEKHGKSALEPSCAGVWSTSKQNLERELYNEWINEQEKRISVQTLHDSYIWHEMATPSLNQPFHLSLSDSCSATFVCSYL